MELGIDVSYFSPAGRFLGLLRGLSALKFPISDICHPRRLRQVAKAMESFGTRIQFSVFECALDELRLNRLKAALHPLLNQEEDQVLFVSLGPEDTRHSIRIEALGLPYLERSRVVIV